MQSASVRVGPVVLLLAVLLGGCGAPPAGDPVSGQKLFAGETPIGGGDAPSCAQCHAVEAGESAGPGPNLSNIGNRAATTIQGMAPQEYLRASIVDPDAYLAGDWQEGIHWRGYGNVLTSQQLNDLVAYLLTLRSGSDE